MTRTHELIIAHYVTVELFSIPISGANREVEMPKAAETRKKKRAPPDLGPPSAAKGAAGRPEGAAEAAAPVLKRRRVAKHVADAGGEPSAPGADPAGASKERLLDAGDDFVPLDAAQEPVALTPVKAGRKKPPVLGAEEGSGQPTVIYVGHIPHGFYEDQMAGFFGQFGTIRHLRLSRNKKTNKSKHYAFLEFESPEVAAIVADCMNNYLLFGCILQVKLVPREKVHPMLWKGANRTFKKIPWQRMARDLHNRDRSQGEQKKAVKRLLRSDRRRKAKLEAAGISYEYLGVEAILPAAPKRVKFE